MKKLRSEAVNLTKIVYGGQSLGQLEDGKKIFVWGALPGETAQVEVMKAKRNYAEGIATNIITTSANRVEPKDPESFLSTSPWQIMSYDYENKLKQELIVEQFKQHGVSIKLDDYTSPEEPYFYRNKVEFTFWWERTHPEDEKNQEGELHLAFYKRGTHTKQPVEGTSLANPVLNVAALKIRDYLRTQKIQARDLKSLLLRSDHQNGVVAELYVKEKDLKISWPHEDFGISGFSVHFSNPKSPTTVKSKTLFSSGSNQLTDSILGKEYTYAADGFFQVNLSMYESALKIMGKYIDAKKPILDFYSGVGSIGLSLADKNQELTMIEIDERCVKEAKANAKVIKPEAQIVLSSSESAIEQIDREATIILDPPRAGLHQKVIDQILSVEPKTLVYLSCNPATQARDMAQLSQKYKIKYAHGFNFFPRTPHIENLIILELM